MKLKKLVLRLTAILLILSFSSTTAFAGLNLGNDDGTNFKGGTSNNYWGVYTDGGIPLNDTEGLRVTVYNAKTNDKAFNTIDITGNANISAASAMQYFSDGNELISKTTWLNYVSSTYNSVSESDMSKFNSAVMSRASSGGGYKSQYIPDLASIDIVSVNNSSNLAAIKEALSSVNFLKNLCDLIGGGLTYEDIAQGKYKIAFEPVAYFRYNGQNWAMSATECGLLRQLKPNETAMSVTVKSLANGLSGKLQQGDIIQIVSVDEDDKAQIFEELQYVEVLATTSDKGSDNTYNDGEVNANAEDEEEQSLYATVTIILQDRAQALRLAECENTSLHAIFVCRGDEEYKQKCLKAQLDLLTGGADETAEATSEADTEEAQPAMNIPENKNQNNAPAGSEEAAHGA